MKPTPDGKFVITIDDDPMVSKILESATGHASVSFDSAREIMNYHPNFDPLAIFIDIHLGADECGLDKIPELKVRWPYCPVIVVTGDPDDEFLLDAFRKGADDFLLKPIKPKEVQARFFARLTSLQEKAHRSSMASGDILLDTALRLVTGPVGRQFLAPVESLLLSQLIKARGTVVAKDVLKREAWGPIRVSDNAFYRKLFELRRALTEVSSTVKIQSVYGEGLKLHSVDAINKRG